VVLLNPAARRVCLLNPVAAAIWDLIDEGQTLDAIVRLLVAAVPANAGRVRADVRAAVRTFLDNGMVDIAERPSVRPRRPA
jgi:hypothetical protein